MRLRRVIVAGLAVLAGCGNNRVDGPPPSAPRTFSLTSPAFGNGETIPARFTCEGEDVSPPLRWHGFPEDTRELTLIVEDPDAEGGTFVHWTVLGISREAEGFEEGNVVRRTRFGENSSGRTRWDGPCPPEGDPPHRYQFLLYATDEPSGLGARTSPDRVRRKIKAMKPLARAVLEGRFSR